MAESLGCARCGDCCENIWVRTSLERLAQWRADGSYDDRPEQVYNIDFMVRHWHPNPPREDGEVSFSCDQFDSVHRLCLARDTRPPVCRDYPWYGGQPRDGVLTNPRCSYLLDLKPDERPDGARPLIPIEVL